jgi:uncharacterized protein YdiU (UPF0061 family)
LIDGYGARFQVAYAEGMRRKLGLLTEGADDLSVAHDLLTAMANNGADFTNTFRALCDAVADEAGDEAVRRQFFDPGAYDTWAKAWRARLAGEAGDPAVRRAMMRAANPAFIPRNHRVEAAIEAAVAREDLAPFEALLRVLSRPYDDQPDFTVYTEPPRPEEVVKATFCGT